MNTSQEIDKISAALVKAQGEFKAVAKSATNPHFRSKYASLDAILEMAVPVLNANGISLIQQVGDDRLGTVILHESGQWIEGGSVKLVIDKQNMQGLGSAITYARRYTLGAMLGIATDEDDDANGASTPPAAKKQAAATTATASTQDPASAAQKPDASAPVPVYDERLNQACEKWQDWKTQKGATLLSIVNDTTMDEEKKVAGLEAMKRNIDKLASREHDEMKRHLLERDAAFVQSAIEEFADVPF